MPEVVDSYLTGSFPAAFAAQKQIIDDYYNDIAKYAPLEMKDKVRECLFSIPSQLMKDNTKFKYSLISSSAKSRDYASSLN
jgi:hypothetical protein